MRTETHYFEAILNATTESVFLVDVDGVVLTVNETAAQRLNQPRAEMIGKCVFDYFPPEAAEVRRRYFDEVARTGKSKHTEDTRGGRHFLLNYHPVKDDGGRVTAVAVFATEITARKLAEEALHERDATFKKLFDDSADAILLIDSTGVFVECNQAALTLLKMTREQFLLSPPSRISPEYQPDGRRSADSAPEMIALAYRNGLHRFDWTCINSEGGEFIVEVSLMPIVVKGQTMLHTMWRDVSERKRTEDALRVSESRHRALFEQAAVGVAQIETSSGRFLELNRKYCEIVGYTDVELKSMDFARITHPEDIAEDLANMDRLRAGEIGEFDMEKRYIHKDGRSVWVRLTVSPLWSPGTVPERHLAVIQDISRRKEMEQTLKMMAHTDVLTGVANRRHFFTLAELEVSRSVRYKKSLSILMIDADLFKNINDTYGHSVGDRTLNKLADVCKETLREVDVVGRMGGEEFAVLLPETDSAKANDVAERLRQAIEESKVPLESGLPLKFTVSIGVASLTSEDDNIDVLLNHADVALYKAKRAGRNKVCADFS